MIQEPRVSTQHFTDLAHLVALRVSLILSSPGSLRPQSKKKKKTLKQNSILQSCQKLRLGQFTFPVLAQGSCDARGLFLNPSLPCCGWAWPGPQGLGHSHLSQRLTSAHKPLWAPSTWQGQLLWGWNTWEVWAPRHQF